MIAKIKIKKPLNVIKEWSSGLRFSDLQLSKENCRK